MCMHNLPLLTEYPTLTTFPLRRTEWNDDLNWSFTAVRVTESDDSKRPVEIITRRTANIRVGELARRQNKTCMKHYSNSFIRDKLENTKEATDDNTKVYNNTRWCQKPGFGFAETFPNSFISWARLARFAFSHLMLIGCLFVCMFVFVDISHVILIGWPEKPKSRHQQNRGGIGFR